MAEALAPTRHRSYAQRLSLKPGSWTMEEDEKLRKIMANQSPVCWAHLAKDFPNRTAQQLAGRWEKVLNPGIIKGSWTAEEDQTILSFVNKHGLKEWAKLAKILPGRTGKQCRERFRNQLSPKVSKSPWTPEEDMRLIALHESLGNVWTKLATYFEGRTDNCVKNRWYSTLKKREERQQKGEPIALKRGRKPKVSPSSSPDVHLTNCEPEIQLFVPDIILPSPIHSLPSLMENRLELEKALSV